MPELPEVEVTRQGLLSWLPGRVITRIHWSGKRLRQPLPLALLDSHILGNRIRTIDRRAKYLLIRMADAAVLLVHLGMTGKLGLFSPDTSVGPHDHLRLLLDDGRELRFNDQRRFGSITVWPGQESPAREQALNQNLGLEPLARDFTAQALADLAAGRRAAIKTLLMNSRLIAGIGNIYANEILYGCRIHPATRSSDLSLSQWRDLVHQTRIILERAISAGGSTISDFLNASGRPGYFQLQLAVYGKKGQPCPACSSEIEKIDLAGRATYFCPCCQRPPSSFGQPGSATR